MVHPPDPGAHDWVVVIPVKPLAGAKTRLARPDRAELALAMATDTVAAVRALDGSAAGRNGGPVVAAVVVVTDDPRARVVLAREGAVIVPDTPDAGLNAALVHGAAVAAARWPGRGVAALSADLAALRPAELARALAAAAAIRRTVVADADGTGTVLLTAGPGHPLAPAFGVHSRAAHTAAGAVDLTDRLGDGVAGLRRDVDTVADLREAQAIGVGPATRAVLDGGPQASVRDGAGGTSA